MNLTTLGITTIYIERNSYIQSSSCSMNINKTDFFLNEIILFVTKTNTSINLHSANFGFKIKLKEIQLHITVDIQSVFF